MTATATSYPTGSSDTAQSIGGRLSRNTTVVSSPLGFAATIYGRAAISASLGEPQSVLIAKPDSRPTCVPAKALLRGAAFVAPRLVRGRRVRYRAGTPAVLLGRKNAVVAELVDALP